jgi:hypothetical protein
MLAEREEDEEEHPSFSRKTLLMEAKIRRLPL